MKEESAFLDLLKSHGGIIHKVAGLYCDHEADREDLRQEITYQLWKSFGSFRGESAPGTWMYRVALNTALTRFRRRSPTLIFRERLPEPGIPSEEEAEPSVRLMAAIRQLPRADRALMALYLEGMHHREIGGILGLSENNVGVKLHRIKNKLKNLLNN
ncbi:RNA polymerase sigma factor [Lewinella sp. W8]|uniref:RNA polymerase sigma factor n=1 Tax=Lewinella sp. W8 TaxID=2528208 RepID=UPI00106724D3|nr:sigma-70 family RNA polymerase sigma factor [Lewinella sp. W8]MTB49474.1 sigma-70 family RNA polymerase sigma factor [Lewinella sp. W8]